MSRLLRLQHSPLISDDSPTAATMTSALRDTAMVSSRISLSERLSRSDIPALASSLVSCMKLEPLAYSTSALSPTASFMACSSVLFSSKRATRLHVPDMLRLLLPNGPTRAMRPFFCKGSILPLFFRRTNVSAAMLRASARWAGVKISFLARFSLQ